MITNYDNFNDKHSLTNKIIEIGEDFLQNIIDKYLLIKLSDQKENWGDFWEKANNGGKKGWYKISEGKENGIFSEKYINIQIQFQFCDKEDKTLDFENEINSLAAKFDKMGFIVSAKYPYKADTSIAYSSYIKLTGRVIEIQKLINRVYEKIY